MATVVKKRPEEKEESLIARFRRKVQNEQILTEYRDREFYKPPSVKKKGETGFVEKEKEKQKVKWRFWLKLKMI